MKVGIWIVNIVNTFASINATIFCKESPDQDCRMMCLDISCPSGQCVMRTDNCCEYNCENMNENINENTNCPQTCPMFPCPMPAIRDNCHPIDPEVDNCGCPTGCPMANCGPTIVGQGSSCGGFVPYGMMSICAEGLECANTMGPMIADAPGQCLPICNTIRDNWGNCIDNCEHWYDGCNQCNVVNNILECTEKACYNPHDSYCMDNLDDIANIANSVPKNCLTWYDGCNTCSTNHGVLQGCTYMMCFVQNEPYCQTFTTASLSIGDICYRFCEDGSQNSINRRDECPSNSECASSDSSMVSFDTCGSRAHTCIIISGH